MLVLTRRKGEKVVISGPDGTTVLCTVTLVSQKDDRVRIGFDADMELQIHRQEVWDLIQAQRAKGELP